MVVVSSGALTTSQHSGLRSAHTLNSAFQTQHLVADAFFPSLVLQLVARYHQSFCIEFSSSVELGNSSKGTVAVIDLAVHDR